MIDVLADPWRDELTRRALLDLALLGAAAGALGCWVLSFRLAYASESLAHGLLPGLVVAALAGFPLLLGAAGGALVAAGAIAAAARLPGVGRDSATAAAVTVLVGAGALLALSADVPPDLGKLLFGDVLAVGDNDLLLAGGMALVVAVALAVAHWSLLAAGFDRGSARALGRDPRWVDLALALLLAFVVVVAVQALGSLLVLALLIGPAAAASAVTDRMATRMIAAAGIAVVAAAAGLSASHHLDVAAGAAVAGALVLAAVPAVARRPLR